MKSGIVKTQKDILEWSRPDLPEWGDRDGKETRRVIIAHSLNEAWVLGSPDSWVHRFHRGPFFCSCRM